MFRKNLFFVFFCIILLDSALANLLVKNWKQDVVFNNKGQEITVTLDLIAEGLGENYYYSSWSFIFDEKSKINFIDAKFVNVFKKENKTTFENNKITFDFDKLFNNKKITISFKYQEINDEIENLKYMRYEAVQIPKMAVGKSSLKVTVPTDLDVYSLNDKFTQNNNIYTWSGNIEENEGFFDVFQMTKKKARWDLSTRVEITNDYEIKDATVTIPLNFVGGNNNIADYTVYNNQINYVDGEKIIKNEKDNTIVVNFKNLNSTKAFVEVKSLVENNYNNFYWLNDLDLNTILTIDNNYESELVTLAQKILQNNNSKLPFYAKIGKWVHENIKYDMNYFGKTMTSAEILRIKKGVCEHYSVLYQDLLRSLGIPAQVVTGISYSYDKKTFENHAWVIVNHNGAWIPLDPTWGIFSGKLPISHIFVSNYLRQPYKFSTTSKMQNFKMDIKTTAMFIE
jgi:hypothetical protein